MGQHGGNPLHGAARAPAANRGVQRGGTRRFVSRDAMVGVAKVVAPVRRS
jgi:hypothetical protein